MRIPNPAKTSLEDLMARLLPYYPTAIIKKPWLTPRMIVIKRDNMRLFVRGQKNSATLITDFTPPVAWSMSIALGFALVLSLIVTLIVKSPSVAGIGGIPFVLAFFVTKAIYRSRHKDVFSRFDADVARALQGAEERSIF